MKNSETQIGRRDFLKSVGLAAPLILAAPAAVAAEEKNPAPAQTSPPRAKEISTDLVIIGGGLGGCAAALAAARNGLNVILTEETDWLGVQPFSLECLYDAEDRRLAAINQLQPT